MFITFDKLVKECCLHELDAGVYPVFLYLSLFILCQAPYKVTENKVSFLFSRAD